MEVFPKTKKTSGVQKLDNGDLKLFDKLEDREYSREERIERFKRLCAYRKTLKRNGRLKGVVIINNGVKCKSYDADLPIPEGWERGYIKKECKNEQ